MKTMTNGSTDAVVAVYVQRSAGYKVRTSCGHIVERNMREATAGIPWSSDVIIDAPNGRPCDACETVMCRKLVANRAAELAVLEARWAACSGHERDIANGTLLCKHCGKSLRAELDAIAKAVR